MHLFLLSVSKFFILVINILPLNLVRLLAQVNQVVDFLIHFSKLVAVLDR